MDLLLRFQEPSAGRILCDGIDLRRIDPNEFARMIGVIPQSTYLFNDNLRNNLLLAKPDATDENLEHVLEQVKLREWFEALPQGLETWIGEHGMKLSAGERQRLAAARVILENPEFVLLDEPTANLDPINEREILGSLFSFFREKAILLVSHRLTLLEVVDEILVLTDGVIAERGIYAELMEKDGIFKRLAAMEGDRLLLEENTENSSM